MRGAALLLLGMIGCASTQPGPFFKDDQYLRFGVNPGQEANDVIESQKARNFVLAQRQLGRTFTALGFMDRGGRSSAVRVLTARGTALALDSRPGTPLQAAATYALLAPPIEGTFDADKDGFEEVFVEERSNGETCVRVYRVRDVGAVDPVAIETRVWGQAVCPRAAIDLDGDGVVELVTEVELAGFPGLAVAPRMPLPLWADGHRFVARASGGAAQAWVVSERARREVDLKDARGRLDAAESFALGVELAALEYLERGEPAAQVAAFDAALNGLVLSPPLAAANAEARRRIFTDWNDPDAVGATAASAPVAAAPAATAPAAARAPAAAARTTSAAQDQAALERALAETRSSKASSAEADDESGRVQHGIRLRPMRRGRPEPLPEPEPAPFWAQPKDPDEPVLADGEFIITPESAKEEAARRRAEKTRGKAEATMPTSAPVAAPAKPPSAPSPRVATMAATTSTSTTKPAPSAATAATTSTLTTKPAPPAATTATTSTLATKPAPPAATTATTSTSTTKPASPAASPAPAPTAGLSPDREAARELGNAAFAARARASAARQAAMAARREAQAERVRAAHATDAAAAAEHRKRVAEHIATADRLAAEAAAHGAEAAKHRDALLQLKGVAPAPQP